MRDFLEEHSSFIKTMGIVLILIVAGINILSTVLGWGGIILFAIGSYYGRGKNQSDLNEEANEEV